MLSSDLFSNNLDEHPLPPPPVKRPIKNLLPRPKVEPALRHRHHHLAPHHAQLRVALRFRWASAKLAYGKPLSFRS